MLSERLQYLIQWNTNRQLLLLFLYLYHFFINRFVSLLLHYNGICSYGCGCSPYLPLSQPWLLVAIFVQIRSLCAKLRDSRLPLRNKVSDATVNLLKLLLSNSRQGVVTRLQIMKQVWTVCPTCWATSVVTRVWSIKMQFHAIKILEVKLPVLHRVRIVKQLTQHVVRGDFWVPTNGSSHCWWWGYQSAVCIHDWFEMGCHFSPSLIQLGWWRELDCSSHHTFIPRKRRSNPTKKRVKSHCSIPIGCINRKQEITIAIIWSLFWNITNFFKRSNKKN